MESITVKTWSEKDYLTMEDGYFSLYYLKQEKVIPFSQVISFSLKDPKSKMRPGMIKLKLGGAPDTMLKMTSFLSVGNSSDVEFPHGYKYLEEGREMQKRFGEWQSRQSAPPVRGDNAIADEAVTGRNIADEIRELKSLFDDGIITQQEFEEKKKQLLDKWV